MPQKTQNIIRFDDPFYPKLLSHIHKPPGKLFYRGNSEILNGNLIAFVGTRNFTAYGKFAAEKLIEELSLCNVVIVSGLAYGIDTISHEAALKNGLKTAAVLGTSVSEIYPPENQDLAERIVAAGGCLLSEYLPGSAFKKFHFPERNRIISGLSVACVIVEAPESSGALLTARLANEQERDVFAVPADIDRISSYGCNKLIQSLMAKPVMCGADIVREISIQPSFFKKSQLLDGNLAKVLESVSWTRPTTCDQIIKTSNLTLTEVNKSLSLLEINMLIISTDSGAYLRI